MGSYLAIDVGGGGGRAIVGLLESDRLELRDLHRFPNNYVRVADRDYWDTLHLFHEMLECTRTAQEVYPTLTSLGADLWGNDCALLGKNGQIVALPLCTRNSDGSAMRAFFERLMPPERYFELCGCQIRRGNAVFQLYEKIIEGDPCISAADSFVMLPDLFGYLFTGKKYNEFTVATTSQLLDPRTSCWNRELIGALGLSYGIFGEIVMPGTKCFDLLPGLLPEASALKYVPVASHDTASAVAATSLESDDIFCSSGTWTIIGACCEEPVIGSQVLRHNFSNEGSADGSWRLQKDVMGMWCAQNLMRAFRERRPSLDWDSLVSEAETAEPFRSLVNLDEPCFTSDADPAIMIRDYCAKTSQPLPESTGQLARCVYDSMALRYAMTVEELRFLSGRSYSRFRIIGGGGKNRLLNQLTADLTGLRVEAGPDESASIGNILIQAVAAGELCFSDFTDIVSNSFEITPFEPKCIPFELRDELLGRFSGYCDKSRL